MANPRPKPVTEEELESFLDLTARLMDRAGRNAELYLPCWRAIERKLNEMRDSATILAAARERLTRSNDRTATRS